MDGLLPPSIPQSPSVNRLVYSVNILLIASASESFLSMSLQPPIWHRSPLYSIFRPADIISRNSNKAQIWTLYHFLCALHPFQSLIISYKVVDYFLCNSYQMAQAIQMFIKSNQLSCIAHCPN